jgi:hypothetical protein
MTTFQPNQIRARRAHLYRRTKTRRVQTIAQAEAFVREVEFCFFWPIKGVEMPSLFHAIAGRERDVPMAHDDPDLSKCWSWKDQSLGLKRWYYGKLLCKRAMLISLNFLPVFYALSPNYGDDADYLHEYEAGLLSREAKNIYEALYKGGAMDTVRLRRESGLAASSANSSFERALTELQVGMKILPVGVAEAGAWRYAFVYDLVTRHFPELVTQAAQFTRRQAQSRLVSRYLANVVVASAPELKRVFGVLKWTAQEWERTLSGLVDTGQAVKVRIAGSADEQFSSSKGREA